jgi:hypothetical protein
VVSQISMSDSAELHGKILSFLAGEFARKEGRQCVAVEIIFAPGNGFKEEPIRKWVRADDPDLFDNFANVEKLVGMILEIATGEADAKPAGKYHFKIRTHQHLGERPYMSFPLSPSYNGSGDEGALVPVGGGSRGGDVAIAQVLAQNNSQLMRTNTQMFEGTIRVLGQQNANLHEQNTALMSENTLLRRRVEEAESNKMDREFQIAMAAEKNARTNAGFQKLLQIGSVVAAKIGGGEDGKGADGPSSPLAILMSDFGKSLRPDQINVLMGTLDMAQKLIFFEIMNIVLPNESKPDDKSGGAPPPNGFSMPPIMPPATP